jgi:hypothetical protein
MTVLKTLSRGETLYLAVCGVAVSSALLGGAAAMFDGAAHNNGPLPVEMDTAALAVCDLPHAAATGSRERCRARVIAQWRASGAAQRVVSRPEKARTP